MKTGTRVDTPAGPGTIAHTYHADDWTFGTNRRTVWIVVQLDDHTRRVFPPADLVEQEAETEWPA